MSFDEFSLLKPSDQIELKGKLSGNYTFICKPDERVILKHNLTNIESSYYLSDIGVLPYEASNLWNGSNYILSRTKKTKCTE